MRTMLGARTPRRLVGTCAVVVAAVVGLTGCNLPSGVKSDEQSKVVLFPDRPDRRDEDYDRKLGSSVDVQPWEARVTATEFKQEFGPGDISGYLIVHLSVKNIGVGKREPEQFHWQLLTPSGDLRNKALVTGGPPPLSEEELAKDAAVSGTLVFSTNGEKGKFYVVFAPVKGKSDPRGVWGPIEVA